MTGARRHGGVRKLPIVDLYGKCPYNIDMTTKSNRTARLEARIAPDVLDVVKRAAELQGRSVSDFIVAAAHDAAARTIEESHILRLAVEDQRIFAAAIIDPPAPSANLKRAAKAYRRLIKASQ